MPGGAPCIAGSADRAGVVGPEGGVGEGGRVAAVVEVGLVEADSRVAAAVLVVEARAEAGEMKTDLREIKKRRLHLLSLFANPCFSYCKMLHEAH